jgi:hypothetical protein
MQNYTKQLQICHQADIFLNVDYVVHSILFYFEVKGFHQRNLRQSLFNCIMSQYPRHSCKTPPNLDLYPFVKKRTQECKCRVLGRG